MTLAPKRLLLISFLAVATLAASDRARAEVSATVSLSFQPSLAPYGDWVVVANYGRVWRPRGVAVGWRPYYHGRWVWTDQGWFWDSDEPWGWATYHYGRWYVDPAYGWVWVPGYEWAPAWVTWRFGGGAIGWAPLFPGYTVWWTAGYPVQHSAWTFVPEQGFVDTRVESVAYAPARTSVFLSTTRVAPPRSASRAEAPRFGGPTRQHVERQIGRPIAPARVTAAPTPEAARAGRREGIVSVYRPPHLEAGRSGPQGAARSAPQAGTARPVPPAETARPRPHAESARPPPRAETAPQAETARPQPRPEARPSPHGEMARPAPHAETARPAPHGEAPQRPSPGVQRAPSQAEQGRAAPQRRQPPAEQPGRQAKKSSGESGT
ncbi:MAG TPA: DUF6600 domain-containing protein [Anaeromyxobacteraceae bacterium]|nr:DUF6600 domain-containing protein [Anaeromyxobacteraceae bacterium]